MENGTFQYWYKKIFDGVAFWHFIFGIFLCCCSSKLFPKAPPQSPWPWAHLETFILWKCCPKFSQFNVLVRSPWQLPQGTKVAPHTCATNFPVSKLFFFKATVRQYRCKAAKLSPTTTSQNCYKCISRNFSIPWLDGFFRRASERYGRILFYLLIYLLRFSSSYYFYFVIFPFSSSSHLHIFRSSHLLIFPFSYLHIFSSCPLALLPSCTLSSSPLDLLVSCPFIFLSSCLVALLSSFLLFSCLLVFLCFDLPFNFLLFSFCPLVFLPSCPLVFLSSCPLP